MEVHSSS